MVEQPLNETLAREVVPIPLPNDVPAPPDLSALPSHIVHSATVELLLQQIEDISARLKVNIRRNSILEGQILELKDERDATQDLARALETRVAILSEKDNASSVRYHRLEAEQRELKVQIQKLTEAHSLSELERDGLRSDLSRHQRFQVRIRRNVRSFVDRLKADVKAQAARIQTLNLDLYEKKSALQELRTRMTELIKRLQDRENEARTDLVKLTESYEHKLAEAETRSRQFSAELAFHRERSQRYDEANQQRVDQENTAIALQRRLEDLQARFLAETTQAREDANRYRQQAHSLTVEREELRQELKSAQTDSAFLRNSNLQMGDQLESLRLLWSESQKDLEEVKLQNESMQKLNGELAKRFREARVTAAGEATTPALLASNKMPKDFIEVTEQPRYDHIDSLLAEIQSGFKMSKAAPSNAPGNNIEPS